MNLGLDNPKSVANTNLGKDFPGKVPYDFLKVLTSVLDNGWVQGVWPV